MSDRRLLIDTAGELFAAACEPHVLIGAEGTWLPELWETLAELGFPTLGVAEEDGGAGGSIEDAVAIARVAGSYAAPVPLVESMLAAWALTAAELALPDGSASAVGVAAGALAADEAGRIAAVARHVPWAPIVDRIVLVAADGAIVSLPRTACTVRDGENLAGEPYGDVELDALGGEDVVVGRLPSSWDGDRFALLAALMRTAQIAGALDRILAMTVEYANQRQQFGRSISSFQAIQEQLAELAGVVVAVGVAVDAAAERADGLAIAAAKAYASDALGAAAAAAHQIHGAIGFTHEHALHLFTRRLWAWRDAAGNELHWSAVLGRRLDAVGADEAWPLLTSAPGA
jgi:alkylation response protein AidB-like acyl-CoA dehydrogenase